MEPSGTSHWVHNLDPVIFQFTETLAIRWYGLAYVAGFLIGFGLLGLYWKRRRSLVNPQIQESLAIAIILGVVVGGLAILPTEKFRTAVEISLRSFAIGMSAALIVGLLTIEWIGRRTIRLI